MDDVTAGRQSPWERFAWVLGVIWVAFMYFPITAALDAPAPQPARIGAIALLIAYAGVYAAAYLWLVRAPDWHVARRRGIRGIAVMIALLAAASLLIGPGGLGAGAFLISIAVFSGPVRSALVLATAVLLGQYAVLAIVLSAVPDGFDEFGILFIPPAIVFVSVACIRLVVGAQEQHDDLERQAALVAERERVARDVHDVLGHSLTIVTVKAELAERLIDIDPERAKDEIAQVRSLARESLAEVRATVSGLRVARLDDEIESARIALAGAGIDAEVSGGADIVDPRHRIVVAWVLREAITNVVRHSGAHRCAVVLDPHGIVVEDDGIGTPDAVAETGLRGIRERVDAAGASLVVGPARVSVPAGATARPGTRVEVRW